MKKKEITFADKAKSIHNRYYKNRKPGEDKITDDAFNQEMEQLMMLQESMKPQVAQPDIQQFANGGGLPKYFGPNDENGYTNFLMNTTGPRNDYGIPDYSMNDSGYLDEILNSTVVNNIPESLSAVNQYAPIMYGQNHGNPQLIQKMKPIGINSGVKSPTELTIGKRDVPTESISQKQFSPKANILGPAVSIAASAIGTGLATKGMKDAEKDARKYANVNLGRVGVQQVDLGRERADIASQAALSEATGRYAGRNARSASELAAIINSSRLGSQRAAGSLLGQSLQKEEMTNAELRARADAQNAELQGIEAMINAENNQRINEQYGKGARGALWGQFAAGTGQTVGNYLAENQRMKDFYAQANMLNPNFELDFQDNYNKLSKSKQRQARWGLRSVPYNKKLTAYGQAELNKSE